MKFLIMVLMVAAFGARAQQVTPCIQDQKINDLSRMQIVAEPWGENTRVFAEGAVRLVVLNTGEPAFASYHLLVMFWGGNDFGMVEHFCQITSLSRLGFYDVTLASMESRYDPSLGLVLTVPVSLYDAESDRAVVQPLDIAINRQRYSVQARFR